MEQSKITKIFKALSSEQRLKLFQMILENSKQSKEYSEILGKESGIMNCCSGMEKAFTRACEILKISRSTVSHHFKELQNAGLIDCQRNGQSIICSVNPEALSMLKNFPDTIKEI